MTPAITTDESRASSGCVHRLVRDFLDARQQDCMELMAEYPDNHFDLAIVDPPYGINVGDNKAGMGRRKGQARGAG